MVHIVDFDGRKRSHSWVARELRRGLESLEGADPKGIPLDVLVSLNFTRAGLRLCERYGIEKARRIAVLFEPPASNPRHANPKWWSLYGTVFVPATRWVVAENVRYFKWPVLSPEGDDVVSRTRTGQPNTYVYRSSYLAGNKQSATTDSLYGLRRELMEEIYRRRYPILVGGRSWNQPRVISGLKSLRSGLQAVANAPELLDPREMLRSSGPALRKRAMSNNSVKDKYDFLKSAPTSIVIENSNTYTSEKLFDALFAGTVPIYVGGDLQEAGIPPEVAIVVEPTIRGILKGVFETSDPTLVRVRQAGQEWISSEHRMVYESSVSLTELAFRISQLVRYKQGH